MICFKPLAICYLEYFYANTKTPGKDTRLPGDFLNHLAIYFNISPGKCGLLPGDLAGYFFKIKNGTCSVINSLLANKVTW